MKKILIIILFPALVYSQLSTGIKTGLSVSSLKFEKELGGSSVFPNFYIGGFFDYKINKIQPTFELIYNTVGTKISKSANGNTTNEYKVNNIQLILSNKLYVTNKLFVKVGIFYRDILNVKQDITFSSTNSNTVDVSSNWKKSDKGFIIGTGFSASKRFFIDINYNVGLSDISTIPNNSVHTKSLLVGLNYRFIKSK